MEFVVVVWVVWKNSLTKRFSEYSVKYCIFIFFLNPHKNLLSGHARVSS